MPKVNGQEVESVDTSQLCEGDTVLSDGMVLTLDMPIKSRPTSVGTVYWTPAKVMNPNDVAGDAMLWGFLHDYRWVDGIGWERYYTGRWTIQGNSRARWMRVVR